MDPIKLDKASQTHHRKTPYLCLVQETYIKLTDTPLNKRRRRDKVVSWWILSWGARKPQRVHHPRSFPLILSQRWECTDRTCLIWLHASHHGSFSYKTYSYHHTLWGNTWCLQLVKRLTKLKSDGNNSFARGEFAAAIDVYWWENNHRVPLQT